MPPSTVPAEVPPRPLPPEQAECCRGDCGEHCVFEVYERELARWQCRYENPDPPESSPPCPNP